ncbi:MAG: hypothetical protein ACI8RD_008986 [Bacillariaceae sp.]|jgi:hypothetical protein
MSNLSESSPSSSDTDKLLEDSDHINGNSNSNDNGIGIGTNTNEKMIDLRMAKAKALSMTFMKSLSGLCCDNCDNDPFKSIGKNSSYGNIHMNINHEEKKNEEDSSSITEIDVGFVSLKNPSTVISPMVMSPMMIEHLDSQQAGTIETIIGEYMCFCRFYSVPFNSGILTTIRFSSPSLRPTGSFHDTDMLALVELLLRHGNGALKHITRLDFSIASKEGRHVMNRKLIGFKSHGALSLAKALQTTKYIREVFLPRHRIGSYGASALFMACRQNKTIEDLNLRRCRIGERGALAFCELILDDMNHHKQPSSKDNKTAAGRRVFNVNLSANQIGHQGTAAIENLLKDRLASSEKRGQIFVNMEGNLVFPEVSTIHIYCFCSFFVLDSIFLLFCFSRDRL